MRRRLKYIQLQRFYFDRYGHIDYCKMKLLELIKLYGHATLEDYYDLACFHSFNKPEYKEVGWTDYNAVARSRIKKRFLRKQYYIVLPKLERI